MIAALSKTAGRSAFDEGGPFFCAKQESSRGGAMEGIRATKLTVLFFQAAAAKYRFCLCFSRPGQRSRNIVLVATIGLKAMQGTRFQSMGH
jgi:hypothetical protein